MALLAVWLFFQLLVLIFAGNIFCWFGLGYGDRGLQGGAALLSVYLPKLNLVAFVTAR